MFIIESNPNREMKILLRGVKAKLGQVPPHFELYATLNPKRFKMFLEEITYLANHENIDTDFFALLRYYVASKNGFSYCVKFNRALLLSKGYTDEKLKLLLSSVTHFPLDERHQKLFIAVIQTLEEPEKFTLQVTENLKALHWTDADIFDAVDHGAFLFRFSKVLKAYIKA